MPLLMRRHARTAALFSSSNNNIKMIRRFRFLFLIVPVAFVAAAALATMGLWNWLMPSLFGFGTLTFIKALGVFALVRLLFGARGWRLASSQASLGYVWRQETHGRQRLAAAHAGPLAKHELRAKGALPLPLWFMV